MPLAFLVIGLAFLISAVRGTQGTLITLIEADFQGSAGSNFGFWLLAIVILGSLGYVPGLKTLSNGLLILVILVILLVNGKNGGFFTKLSQATGNN